MAIDYARDDGNHQVTLTASGDFSADDVLGLFERMRTDGTWAYGVLTTCAV